MTWSFFGHKRQRKSNSRRQHRNRESKALRSRLNRFEHLEKRHLLAVLTVNTASDVAAVGNSVLSLREALSVVNSGTTAGLGLSAQELAQINTTTPLGTNDTIQFDTTVFAAAQTISLVGANDLDIQAPVSILKTGATDLTIDAVGASRVLNITATATDVSLRGLILTGGDPGAGNSGGAILSGASGLLSIADSLITGNVAAGKGGGIYVSGDLLLSNVRIGDPTGATGNDATSASSNGGGVYATGNVTIKNNTTIALNSAGNQGGGVFALGTIDVENSTIGGDAASGNTSADDGGGIWSATTVTLLNSTVSGNKSTTNDGAGIYAGGNATLTNSTVTGNTAAGYGGGIYSFNGSVALLNSTVGGSAAGAGNTAQRGGGIYARTVTTQNSTIAGNVATEHGGGIYSRTTATIRNSTVWGNTAKTNGGGIFGFNVTLQNATVASNTADSDGVGGGNGGGVFATNRLTVNNSIVIGNTDNAMTKPDLSAPAMTTVRSSLIGDKRGTALTATGPTTPDAATGNLVGDATVPANAITIDLVLDSLAGVAVLKNNNGAQPATTETIALIATSIAKDRGNNALVVNPGLGDQRGLPFVRISPAVGRVDMGAFELQTPPATNHSPTLLNAIPDQSTIVGNFFTFPIPANTFQDIDGDVLTYSVGALPSWLSFNAASGVFFGTPAAGDIGSSTIHVTATDPDGASASDDFMLTVTTNPPPVVSVPIADQHATVGIAFNFTVPASTFTDPNNDPLTYAATLTGGGALPGWLSFNAATRTFTGTPALADVGTISVRVTASDNHGGSVSDDFNLVVSNSELPFTETFESPVPAGQIAPDSRIKDKSNTPSFATTTTAPLTGTASLQATRASVGSLPVATVDFADPTTAPNITNVSVNVSTGGGNGTTLWNNAQIVFDYQSPTNYKFAGVFQIIHKLIIGQVVNGKVTYLAQTAFNASANTTIPLHVTINHSTSQVTLNSGGTTVSHTFPSLGTGTVGVGTINANAKFDDLVIT